MSSMVSLISAEIRNRLTRKRPSSGVVYHSKQLRGMSSNISAIWRVSDAFTRKIPFAAAAIYYLFVSTRSASYDIEELQQYKYYKSVRIVFPGVDRLLTHTQVRSPRSFP